MPRTIHFENDYAAIFTDTDVPALALVYKRRGTSPEFRNLHLELLNVFKQHPQNRFYVDVRKMEIAAPEDQKWVGTTIVPQLATYAPNKFLNIATIVDDNVFAKLAVETIEELSNKLDFCVNKHFRDSSSAKTWLAST